MFETVPENRSCQNRRQNLLRMLKKRGTAGIAYNTRRSRPFIPRIRLTFIMSVAAHLCRHRMMNVLQQNTEQAYRSALMHGQPTLLTLQW